MQIENFLGLLQGVKKNGKGWTGRCPGHDDKNPSLSVNAGDDGRNLLKCWSGCTASEIVGAMGLKLADLFPEGRPDPRAIRSAKKKRRKADAVKVGPVASAGVFREAQKVIEAARGIDISSWTED